MIEIDSNDICSIFIVNNRDVIVATEVLQQSPTGFDAIDRRYVISILRIFVARENRAKSRYFDNEC